MLEELKQALKLHKEQNFTQAEKVYLGILQKDQQNFETLQLLGTLYLQTGKFDDSEVFLTKALKINSNNPNVLNNLGILFKNKKDFKKSEIFFKKNIKINNFLDSKINLGNVYILSEKFENALNLFLVLRLVHYHVKFLMI
ncbi:tetratricopeptide repeat protein [Candidatus Pelagibacter sp. HIMB1517]|uniref:tetratricopeptide repeat protein n=1 Tax=Candidatus Pelagibacter sp. HIMB1517 TaxID=3413341 RepID=UPI003F82A959